MKDNKDLENEIRKEYEAELTAAWATVEDLRDENERYKLIIDELLRKNPDARARFNRDDWDYSDNSSDNLIEMLWIKR